MYSARARATSSTHQQSLITRDVESYFCGTDFDSTLHVPANHCSRQRPKQTLQSYHTHTHTHTARHIVVGRRQKSSLVVVVELRVVSPSLCLSLAVSGGSGDEHDCRKIAGRLIISSVSIRDERAGTDDRSRVCMRLTVLTLALSVRPVG